MEQWTKEECELLRLHYNILSIEQLQGLFKNKTEKAIRNKVYRLRRRGWKFKS